MKSPNQRDIDLADCADTAFVQTMYFDMEFNYIRGNVEQISIVPDKHGNLESESCTLIPYVWYEFARVSERNPGTEWSDLGRIEQAREKVRFFALAAKNKTPVLRIVGGTIITKLSEPPGKGPLAK